MRKLFIVVCTMQILMSCNEQPQGLPPEQEAQLKPHLGVLDSLLIEYQKIDSGLVAFAQLNTDELKPELDEYYQFFASTGIVYSREFYMGPLTRLDDLHRALGKSMKEYEKIKEKHDFGVKQITALQTLMRNQPEKLDSLQLFVEDEVRAYVDLEFIYYKRIYRSLNFAALWPPAKLQLDSARTAILNEKND